MKEGQPEQSERRNALVQFYRYVFGIGYERNVGGIERTLRYTSGGLFVILGAGLLAFPVFGNAFWNALLAFILLGGGLYLIYEARVQYCPLNETFDRNTYAGR